MMFLDVLVSYTDENEAEHAVFVATKFPSKNGNELLGVNLWILVLGDKAIAAEKINISHTTIDS